MSCARHEEDGTKERDCQEFAERGDFGVYERDLF